MKKKLLSLLLILLLSLSLSFAACADMPVVLDDGADLLSEADEVNISNRLGDFTEEYNFNIVIVTTDSTGGYTPEDYADNFYGSYCYGDDGILLLISMEDRDWYISTSGYGITAFTDYGIECIGDDIVPYLADGDYYGAFNVFVDDCDQFLYAALNGSPIDSYGYSDDDYGYHGDDYYYDRSIEDDSPSPWWIPGSLLIGSAGAFIPLSSMKSKMNSVRPNSNASSYVRKGSLRLRENEDTYLHSAVTRTPIPKDDSSRSGPGGGFGGSSTHMSAGGHMHGGGGGKF